MSERAKKETEREREKEGERGKDEILWRLTRITPA